MKRIYPVICFLVMIMAVTSCAQIRRESRFIPDAWPEGRRDINRNYFLSTVPVIRLSSSCEDENVAFLGPIIVIPLPVIPNPFWPFHYFSNRWGMADLVLIFEAPRPTINWDRVIISMLVNGKIISSREMQDNPSIWNENRRYKYHLELTCGELEDSEISVHLDGLPGTTDSKLFYTYRWTVHTNRM
jgi:hypothetical protein